MRIGILVLSILFISGAATAVELNPICFAKNDSRLKIVGINHVWLNDDNKTSNFIRKTVAEANVVFMESAESLPEDGVWGDPKLLQLPKKPYKLHEVFPSDAMKRLSKLFGGIPADAWTDGFSLSSLPDEILTKSYLDSGGKILQPDMYTIAHNKKTIESSFYAYALGSDIPVYSMESPEDLFKNLEKDFDLLKIEVNSALHCAQDNNCMVKFSNWLSYITGLDNSKSYDEIYDMAISFPSQRRYTLNTRNEFQYKTVASHMDRYNNILVIPGAVHVGGPIGLAKKFEKSGYVKTDCDLK